MVCAIGSTNVTSHQALAAYRAEMAEAEMRAARAVRDHTFVEVLKHAGGNTVVLIGGGDDDVLRAIIEKARGEK